MIEEIFIETKLKAFVFFVRIEKEEDENARKFSKFTRDKKLKQALKIYFC